MIGEIGDGWYWDWLHCKGFVEGQDITDLLCVGEEDGVTKGS